MKQLPGEVVTMVREFASDRVGVHPTAALMHSLETLVDRSYEGADEFTVFFATDGAHFKFPVMMSRGIYHESGVGLVEQREIVAVPSEVYVLNHTFR